jgi:hypothetical protein
MDESAHGPSIGADASEEFIRTANPDKSLSAASVERIRSSMNCARCHSTAAKLNYPQAVKGNVAEVSFEQKKDLAQSYIEQGWMPPKNDLTPGERSALWNALRKQYLDPAGPSGLLVEWLNGK